MKLLLTLVFVFSQVTFASTPSKIAPTTSLMTPKLSELEKEFKRPGLEASQLSNLQKKTFQLAGKAVPLLIRVMKSADFPDRNRWMATFSLGRIMGAKAAPFLAKFVTHPSWLLRVASLKTLLALKQKDYADAYVVALKDESYIVRSQALENIRRLELRGKAPYIWAMLYDKSNYYQPKKKSRKRRNIIKEAIRSMGDLEFAEAKKPLLKMVQKDRYLDIMPDIEYSLQKLTGKKIPDGSLKTKRRFWKKISVSELTI